MPRCAWGMKGGTLPRQRDPLWGSRWRGRVLGDFLGWSDAVEGTGGLGAGTRRGLWPEVVGGRRPGSGRRGRRRRRTAREARRKRDQGGRQRRDVQGGGWGKGGGTWGFSVRLGQRHGQLYTTRLQRSSGRSVWRRCVGGWLLLTWRRCWWVAATLTPLFLDGDHCVTEAWLRGRPLTLPSPPGEGLRAEAHSRSTGVLQRYPQGAGRRGDGGGGGLLEPRMCSGGQTQVFTFSGNVFSFWGDVFTFWGDVFSLAANVFSEEVERGERREVSRGRAEGGGEMK